MAIIEKRSPLKIQPRRIAGQSVQEEIDNKWDQLQERLGFTLLLFVLNVFVWWQWYSTKVHPIVFTGLSILVIIWPVIQLLRLKTRIRRLKLGRDGEKIVGEELENLRSQGYRVFHDIVGGQFNVDHVLVGPAGVFAVETKTWSKGKKETITSDGETLRRNGARIEPNPIEQARANAKWLNKLIRDTTSESFFVHSAVVFPGWWVECTVKEPQTIVLNPEQLKGYLKTLPARLEESEIALIASRLELIARGK